MSIKTQIFITGATGYVAGSVVDRLLRHPTFTTSEITVLTRKAEKASAFESLGIKAIVGSYDDHALLERHASQSDIFISCADADDAAACAAILKGLKKKYEATGKPPILIHTSGTAILIDDPKGNYATETIWADTDAEQLDTIADTQLHRNVDTLVLAADRLGYVKTYLVVPPTIYGFASGKLVDLGVQNRRSIQIPLAVTVSIARKRAGHVGKGLNVWPHIHIDDIADLYIVLYDAILGGKELGHGREGYYFGENGHYVFKDISVKIGEALYALGVSDTAEPSEFTDADYEKFPFARFLGTNCRCKATRARALGWEPKYGTDDLLNSIRAEVEWQLKHPQSA